MPLAAPRRNIELKARDRDPEASLNACLALGATDHGIIWQRDTYFDVPRGGLKLREEQPGSAHLVQFSRAEQPQQRERPLPDRRDRRRCWIATGAR